MDSRRQVSLLLKLERRDFSLLDGELQLGRLLRHMVDDFFLPAEVLHVGIDILQ